MFGLWTIDARYGVAQMKARKPLSGVFPLLMYALINFSLARH